MITSVDLLLAVFIGANLLFMIWVWFRSRPGSGDALLLPGIILLSISMLIGILPKIFWPSAERIQIAGSIASVVLTIVVTVASLWRIRTILHLRRKVPPGIS
jgi:hypothetical protein